MVFKSIIGATCTCLAVISFNTSAALIDRGGGLIYDDVLNITWLQDANYAMSNGDDADGSMNWYEATAWAANLNYYDSVRDVTYDDWRLPITDGTFSPFIFAPTNCEIVKEEVCRGSELGYMYYYNLGGNRGDDLTGNQGSFINIQNVYWFETDNPLIDSNGYGFQFAAGSGGGITQYAKSTIFNYAWAVRDGNVVPIPAAVWLFGSGLLGLVGLARRKA
jgi:hypothetical protein